jgi:hypothetical protein
MAISIQNPGSKIALIPIEGMLVTKEIINLPTLERTVNEADTLLVANVHTEDSTSWRNKIRKEVKDTSKAVYHIPEGDDFVVDAWNYRAQGRVNELYLETIGSLLVDGVWFMNFDHMEIAALKGKGLEKNWIADLDRFVYAHLVILPGAPWFCRIKEEAPPKPPVPHFMSINPSRPWGPIIN